MSFGPYAAVAAGNVHAYQSARNKADNLQAALETRAVIEQAKGVLIERYKVTPDQAFRLLAVASMNANRKLRMRGRRSRADRRPARRDAGR